MSPGACSAAGVALVFVTSHAWGSIVPLRQTLALTVVVGVPVTRSRVRRRSPGFTRSPGTVVFARMVSVPATVRVRYAMTEPSGW